MRRKAQTKGALRQPGRILAEQDAAPLSRLTPTAPLTGEPGWQALDKASPARGGVTEGDEGVHCRFASEISCKPRQNPALCFAGDDLRAKSRHFVLCAPKRRLRAAVLASSRKACDAANPKRRAKSPGLQSACEETPAQNRRCLPCPCGRQALFCVRSVNFLRRKDENAAGRLTGCCYRMVKSSQSRRCRHGRACCARPALTGRSFHDEPDTGPAACPHPYQ